MDLLEKMRTYARVVDAKSLSAAAKQLRISPAAVSRQLSTLERELGITLLTRSTRSMALTDAGRDYYERCVGILREVDEAQQVGRGDPLDGPLSVSAPVTFGTARVIPHLEGLRKKHPRLRLDLRLEDRFVDPVSDGVDVLVRVSFLFMPPEALVAHKLTSYRRVLVAAPSYLRTQGEPKMPGDLTKHGALTYFPPDRTETLLLERDGEVARPTVSSVFRSNSLYAIRELAVAGDGIALLPEWFVATEVAARRLRVLLPGWQSPLTVAYAMHRVEQRGAPRVRAFIDYLKKALA